MVKKETIKEVVDRLWPKAKKELDKGVENAKKVLVQSEKYLKEISEKGVAQTKKISLSLKREKAYYDLGKVIASTAAANWKTNRKITSLIKKIKRSNKGTGKTK